MPKKIFCCECKQKVEARLATGCEIYPTREDLHKLSFYKCDICNNYVGVHVGTLNPLGTIPTPQLRTLRNKIHKELDPLWQGGKYTRKHVYAKLAFKLGVKEFHTAEVNNISFAKLVLKEIENIYLGA